MNKVPSIIWPEDGIGGEIVIDETRDLFGKHTWIAIVPNPRPHVAICDQIALKLSTEPLPTNNTVAFVLAGQHLENALQTAFVWGPPEWVLLGFSEQPDPKMIACSLDGDGPKPAHRLLHFDSNCLIAVL